MERKKDECGYVIDYLEANELINAVELNMNDYSVRVVYEITDKGRELLKKHEAPVDWWYPV